MKKNLILAVIIIFLFQISSAFAQSSKEAYLALKKLEAKCETGISYKDYGTAVGETKFPVNMLLEGKEAANNKALAESISKAMGHYEIANTYWGMKFSSWKYGVSKDSEKGIISQYPNADKDSKSGGARLYIDVNKSNNIYVDFLLPVIWAEASKELENTSKLYADIENKSSDETEKLKKINEELNKKVRDLQKEIEILKSQIKK
jgi:hypothetical protein